MKSFIKTGVILSVIMTMMLWNCAEADKEFVHDSNTIDRMICKATKDGTEFAGTITEYDKDRNPVPAHSVTQQKVEGGYGIINIEIPERYKEEIDLENVYLVASLSWDQSITPSLSGTHDITGEGIVVTVKSGVGTKRNYRIQGFYEE